MPANARLCETLCVSLTLYGIKNCDTMKKARQWLADHQIDYRFHDYKVAGIEAARLQRWSRELGWQRLLNRAGTTYRKLSEAQKTDLDEPKALALMLENPSLIKRPVLEHGQRFYVGFDPVLYQRELI